ncbi:MAG: hypothetical protein EOO52_12750 [Gammaproteobacteria bacterium]|nr:MAG: hypothetical protein EOO52_12750 [Gammaproteobacteria bacterium]
MSEILYWKYQTLGQVYGAKGVCIKIRSAIESFATKLPDLTRLTVDTSATSGYPDIQLDFTSRDGAFNKDKSFSFGFKDFGMINVVKWSSFGGSGHVRHESGLIPLLFLTYLAKEVPLIHGDMSLSFTTGDRDDLLSLGNWSDLCQFLESINEDPSGIRCHAIATGLTKELFAFNTCESKKPSAFF